jgi:hypothetical protein
MFGQPGKRPILELIQGDRQLQPRAPGKHHTPYLSASRLVLYQECPALYQRRYVDKIIDPPTIDMEYGQAIHAGLDAHFKGGDGELAFLRELDKRLQPLVARGADPADWLVPQGMKLLSDVMRLGWAGESEQDLRWICSGFKVPLRGVIDLWMPSACMLIDWKTTQHPWSEKTIERYAFQRTIYTQHMLEKTQREVIFKFVALGAYPGGYVQIIEATPSPGEVYETLEKARAIAAKIEAEQWTCTCRDKKHLEQAA